ncbi:DUF7289 family protein [Methanogenium organophilum]|uniref:Uncharacterized protein n=1 Tax=Methanogenium organophilum TaxID=2199 RepID=A0A9X9S2A4_METOG|nr:hypothetical protein [Methanogenium organophilum]WAI00421.1 hypothetical protein OU421_08250 [Methanogenium organophilum]
MKIKIIEDESGVSEAIGFILVFTIVILGISIVTLYGYPALADARISSDEKIMEQNMIVLQNDIKILTRSNVPYRDTTIGVSGGSIFVTNSSQANAEGGEHFNITYYVDDTFTNITTYYPGSMEFVSDEGTAVISVANGAVVKRQQDLGGSVMVSDPRWFYDETEGTLVIFMTSLNSTQPMALGGIGTIQMAMLTPPVIHDYSYSIQRPVIIEYFPDPDDDYSRAWETYFTGPYIVASGFTPVPPNAYRLDVDRLVIKEYTVDILGI